MALQIIGQTGTVLEVESGSKAARVVVRPDDIGILGSYALTVTTGVMAAGLAANAEVFQFRWTDATRLALVKNVTFNGAGSIVAFAAGATKIEAHVARAWTVAGTGGAAATITNDNGKLRTTFNNTILQEARIATTAALGAGTKTLDTQGVGSSCSGFPATAGAFIPYQALYVSSDNGNRPIVISQNEGIVIRATVPATGTWTGSFTISWDEIASY